MDQSSDGGTSASPPSASTRPYLIRALHDWCTDNGFTPYIAVHVDRMVQVPKEYVSNSEIVLNVGFDATSGLELGNEFIQFKARFGGVAREIVVPVDHVVAIYARENGQGMAFPAPSAAGGNETAALPVAVTPLTSAAPAAAASPVPRGLAGSKAVTPLRGLRLAETPEPPPAAQAPTTSTAAGPGSDDPSPGGGRPALKRIK